MQDPCFTRIFDFLRMQRDSDTDTTSNACDLMAKYVLHGVPKEQLKRMFTQLGMMTSIRAQEINRDIECVIHPDHWEIGMELPTGPQKLWGCSSSNFHLGVKRIQGTVHLNFWDFDYIAAAPHSARKFFDFLGAVVILRLCSYFDVPVKLTDFTEQHLACYRKLDMPHSRGEGYAYLGRNITEDLKLDETPNLA